MARISVLGMSGSGKSYYAGFLLEQIIPSFDLAVHFDLEDEEGGLCDENSPDGALYGTLRVDRERFRTLSWPKAIYRHRKLRVVPEGLTMDEAKELYGRICAAVMLLCKDLPKVGLPKGAFVPESAFISCDEAHNLVPEGRIDERIERMVTGGRKYGVECMHLSQRPQLLHKTIITQADRRIYFSINGSNDLKKINRMCGFDAALLKDLGARRCIVENKDTGEWLEVDTDGVDRKRIHLSGDDGIADTALPV